MTTIIGSAEVLPFCACWILEDKVIKKVNRNARLYLFMLEFRSIAVSSSL